jgi:hypothetical protein
LDPITTAIRPKSPVFFLTRQKKKFSLAQAFLGTPNPLRFEVLMVAGIKMAVFWVVALCSMVEVY